MWERAGAEWTGIGEAQYAAGVLGDQIGEAALDDRLAAGGHVLDAGRDLFEGPEAVQHVMAVDLGQGRGVLRRRSPYDHCSQPRSCAQIAKA